MAATLDDVVSELKNLRADVKGLRAELKILRADVDGNTSELKSLRADVDVLGERMTDVQAAAKASQQLPEEVRLLRLTSQAMMDAALRLGGDHEDRIQAVEKILGLR